MTKNLKKFTAGKNTNVFGIKNYNLPINVNCFLFCFSYFLRLRSLGLQKKFKLQKKLSAVKIEHPALQNWKILNLFSTFVGHSWLRIRIPNTDSDLIESGSYSLR
jgi:hypothetical protein